MAKAGTKPTRKPKEKSKLTDKEQSERFKETARQLGADQESSAFDRIVEEMARQEKGKPEDR